MWFFLWGRVLSNDKGLVFMKLRMKSERKMRMLLVPWYTWKVCLLSVLMFTFSCSVRGICSFVFIGCGRFYLQFVSDYPNVTLWSVFMPKLLFATENTVTVCYAQYTRNHCSHNPRFCKCSLKGSSIPSVSAYRLYKGSLEEMLAGYTAYRLYRLSLTSNISSTFTFGCVFYAYYCILCSSNK